MRMATLLRIVLGGILAIGVGIAQATTPSRNLVENPSAEAGIAPWSHGGVSGVLDRVSDGRAGNWSFRLRTTDGYTGNANVGIPEQAVSPTPCTVSGWVKSDSHLVMLAVHYDGPAFAYVRHPGDGDWHHLAVTAICAANTNISIAVSDPRTIHSDVLFDAIQFEWAAVASAYIDGDQPGGLWVGAPHASPSQRMVRCVDWNCD